MLRFSIDCFEIVSSERRWSCSWSCFLIDFGMNLLGLKCIVTDYTPCSILPSNVKEVALINSDVTHDCFKLRWRKEEGREGQNVKRFPINEDTPIVNFSEKIYALTSECKYLAILRFSSQMLAI